VDGKFTATAVVLELELSLDNSDLIADRNLLKCAGIRRRMAVNKCQHRSGYWRSSGEGFNIAQVTIEQVNAELVRLGVAGAGGIFER
jgi:hypothetical protein